MARLGSILRRGWLVPFTGLLVAACVNPSGDDATRSTTLDERPAAAPPEAGPTGAEALAELAGRLAVTDGSDLVLIDPNGANRQLIDSAAFLGQPTWAPDGSGLAWTRSDDSGEARLETITVDIVVGDDAEGDSDGDDAEGGNDGGTASDDDSPGTERGSSERVRASRSLGDRPAIYLQWTEDAGRLSVLRNTADLVALELSVVEVSLFDGEIGGPATVGTGRPLYTSWGPEDALAVHRGTELHVLDEGELRLPEIPTEESAPDGDDLEREEEGQDDDERDDGEVPGRSPDPGPVLRSQGWFTAPFWSIDGEVLAARPDDLVAVSDLGADEPSLTSLAELRGPTRFVANDDGTRVAYLDAAADDFLTVAVPPNVAGRPGGAVPVAQQAKPSVLHVLDVESGESTVVGAREAREITPVAWEWSPDGRTLAFLAASELDPDLVRWYFWQDGAIVAAASPYRPSAVMANSYLPFFDQYAQSHTGWSPDGSAFAFAGGVQGMAGVYVHVPGLTPRSIRITSGDMVTWSPGNVASGGGVSLL